MAELFYSVTAKLPSSHMAEQYIHWLTDGHIDAVCKAGARSGYCVRLDADPADPADPAGPRSVMTVYIFPTRAAFDHYVAVYAPALRAEGLAKFGPDKGVTMERRLGEIV